MSRRRLLAAGFVLTPLAAALSACGRSEERWPAGMRPIKWDRDTCTRCSMVISDRRFAAEIGGIANNAVFKFDDIGCAMLWLRDKGQNYLWSAEPAIRIWVADITSKSNAMIWLDARTAHYIRKTSPMGYNFGATAQNPAGAMDFWNTYDNVLAGECAMPPVQ